MAGSASRISRKMIALAMIVMRRLFSIVMRTNYNRSGELTKMKNGQKETGHQECSQVNANQVTTSLLWNRRYLALLT